MKLRDRLGGLLIGAGLVIALQETLTGATSYGWLAAGLAGVAFGGVAWAESDDFRHDAETLNAKVEINDEGEDVFVLRNKAGRILAGAFLEETTSGPQVDLADAGRLIQAAHRAGRRSAE